jgi:hypothetical protein
MSGEFFHRTVREGLSRAGQRSRREGPLRDRAKDKERERERERDKEIERWDRVVEEYAQLQQKTLVSLQASVADRVVDERSAPIEEEEVEEEEDTALPIVAKSASKAASTTDHKAPLRRIEPNTMQVSRPTDSLKDLPRRPTPPRLELAGTEKENLLSRGGDGFISARSMDSGDHSLVQERLSLLKQRKAERQKEVHERYAQLLQQSALLQPPPRAAQSSRPRPHPQPLRGPRPESIAADRGVSPPPSGCVAPLSVNESKGAQVERRGEESVVVRRVATLTSSADLPQQQEEPEESCVEEERSLTAFVESFVTRGERRVKKEEEKEEEGDRDAADGCLREWVALGEEMAAHLQQFTPQFAAYLNSCEEAGRLDRGEDWSRPPQSMKDLKAQVQRRAQLDLLQQRLEYSAREVNEALRRSVQDHRARCEAMHAHLFGRGGGGDEAEGEGEGGCGDELAKAVGALRRQIGDVRAEMRDCEQRGWRREARRVLAAHQVRSHYPPLSLSPSLSFSNSTSLSPSLSLFL